MRPLTDYEYKRIQQQAESRMAGMSLVTLKMMAGNAIDGYDEWEEDGFMCDFRISNFSNRSVQQTRAEPFYPTIGMTATKADISAAGATNYTDVAFVNTIGATASMPMRYVYDGGFTVRNNEDYFGVPIVLEPLTANDAPTHDDTPTAMKMELKIYNNRKAEGITDFALVTIPYMTADCVMIELAGEVSSTKRVYDPAGPVDGYWHQVAGNPNMITYSSYSGGGGNINNYAQLIGNTLTYSNPGGGSLSKGNFGRTVR